MKTFLLALALISGTVVAQEAEAPALPVIGSFNVKKVPVLIYKVEEFKAEASSEEEFVKTLSTSMRDYSGRHQVETCALICRAPETNQWGATVITINSRAACPLTTTCPKGMKSVGVDIHSHIHQDRYIPNKIDQLFLRQDYEHRQKVRTVPDELSAADKSNGRAYMVGSTKLLVYDGKRQVFELK